MLYFTAKNFDPAKEMNELLANVYRGRRIELMYSGNFFNMFKRRTFYKIDHHVNLSPHRALV